MRTRSLTAPALVLALVVSSCGGGDDTPAAETSAAADATGPSGAQGADGGTAAVTGTVVMTVGDTTIEADVVECTIAEPDVAFRAEGETAQIEVYAIGDYETGVVVSGAYEFEGKGTAAFNPDTSGLDQGDVMITGSGAQPDDSTPVQDFTIDARGLTC